LKKTVCKTADESGDRKIDQRSKGNVEEMSASTVFGLEGGGNDKAKVEYLREY
jgi:hypothetical protein